MAGNAMRNRKILVALIAGSALCSSASFAADANAPAKNGMADQRMMVSDDGYKAERDIGAARIAIFQGDTDAAKKLVADAKSDLSTVAQKAPKDFPNGAPPADGKGNGNPDVIPIDGQMIVADNMVLTPDKAAKVNEANQHLKAGDTAKALDTLKQGAIDVAFTRVLMPVQGTVTHVDSAAGLLGQGKYYEANLALKAAQDLLRTDTVAFGDTAAQAAKASGLPAASSDAQAAPAKK